VDALVITHPVALAENGEPFFQGSGIERTGGSDEGYGIARSDRVELTEISK
jgi:hypothetical protein